jgi:hypothetical protein
VSEQDRDDTSSFLASIQSYLTATTRTSAILQPPSGDECTRLAHGEDTPGQFLTSYLALPYT